MKFLASIPPELGGFLPGALCLLAVIVMVVIGSLPPKKNRRVRR